MQVRFPGFLSAVVAVCCSLAGATIPAGAQNTPSANYSAPAAHFELYGEYSYFRPQSADIYNNFEPALILGGIAGANYYFSRHLGVEIEGGYHQQDTNFHCMYTGQAGLVGRLPLRRLVPFAHVTGGYAKIAGPAAQPCTAGWGVTGGLGLDYVVPGLGGHLALRPIQADYEYNHIDYGPVVLPVTTKGGLLQENAYRLSAGVVFRLGDTAPKTSTGMSCDASPGFVYAGEPVTVTAQTIGVRSRRLHYAWSASGGQISGTGDTIRVDTAGLPPGNYEVDGRMSTTGRGNQNECSARFAVRSTAPAITYGPLQQDAAQPSAAPSQTYQPAPTAAPPATQTQQYPPSSTSAISCFAVPSNVTPGGSATISVNATSFNGRQLTYTYSTTAGLLSGGGPSATFRPQGMTGGSATITCTIVDDTGRSATATTTVQVTQGGIPPLPDTFNETAPPVTYQPVPEPEAAPVTYYGVSTPPRTTVRRRAVVRRRVTPRRRTTPRPAPRPVTPRRRAVAPRRAVPRHAPRPAAPVVTAPAYPAAPITRLRDYRPPPETQQQQNLSYPIPPPTNTQTIPLPQGNAR